MQQVEDLQSSTQDKHHKCGRLHTWLNKMLRAVYPADLWNVIVSNYFKVDYITNTHPWEMSPVFHLVTEGGEGVYKEAIERNFFVSDFTLTAVRLQPILWIYSILWPLE